MLTVAFASVRAQWLLTRRNVEDLLPVLTMPVFTFVYSGRRDLAGYALIAHGRAEMGFFVASEISSRRALPSDSRNGPGYAGALSSGAPTMHRLLTTADCKSTTAPAESPPQVLNGGLVSSTHQR